LGRHPVVPARLLSSLVDFIYPPVCLICYNPLSPDQQFVCTTCRQSIHRVTSPVVSAHRLGLLDNHPIFFKQSIACFEFDGTMQKLIHEMKYRGMSKLGFILGQELGRCMLNSGVVDCFDVLVPVPLHPLRKRERGYNQALILANGIGSVVDKAVVAKVLYRKRYTRQQAKFDKQERIENVRDAFKIVNPKWIGKKRVALVDDVLTTGSTMNECARVIRQKTDANITAVTLVRI